MPEKLTTLQQIKKLDEERAKLLESANATASTIVVIFMAVSLGVSDPGIIRHDCFCFSYPAPARYRPKLCLIASEFSRTASAQFISSCRSSMER